MTWRETSSVAHERDKDDGNFKIGARSHRVSGQHAEAARIGMHLRLDGDLHGEVGDVSSFEKAVKQAGHRGFFQAGPQDFDNAANVKRFSITRRSAVGEQVS